MKTKTLQLFVAILTSLPGLAGAQDSIGLFEEVTATEVQTGFGDDVDKLAGGWISAWRAKPRLVSLKEKDADALDLARSLKQRLKTLGAKTFSNREWKRYWQQQDKTATTLAKALKAASPTTAPSVAALQAWAGLARDKVENQDRYLTAIETERDALEERLEAALEPDPAEKTAAAAAATSATLPNPYERRRLHLEELRRRQDWQKRKRRLAEMDNKLIQRQLQSEEILLSALVRDVHLARRERDIAQGQAKRLGADSVFGGVWGEIAATADDKVTKLTDEARHGAARKRSREVELGLGKSQLRFRDERIKALGEQMQRDGGFESWADATLQTLKDWLQHAAWRILFGLLLIFIGMRAAIYLTARGLRLVILRAEGDPDDPSDDDTRILTLANVFSGVAKLTIYIIALLLALETIGVNTGPLLGSVAILGLAISFGSQNLVRDVVNGFFILLENQYAVGEVVDLGGKVGTVEEISIRSTWVRGFNGDLHVVPNGSISTVSNLTRDWNRAIVHVGVGYGADLEKVEQVVTAVGKAMHTDDSWKDVLDEAPSFVGVTELGDSAVVVRVLAKCDTGAHWGVERELNKRLKVAFDKAGIEIPFPQMVVWRGAAEN